MGQARVIALDAGAKTFATGLLPDLIATLRDCAPGEVFRLAAHDAGLGADLESWCRMTRNAIVAVTTGPEGTTWTIRIGAVTESFQPERTVGSRLWLYANFDRNLACDYCCVRSSPRAPCRALGLDRFRQIATEAAALDISEIFVTGGEPFLLPDIAASVMACAATAPTTLLTNGMLSKGRRREALRELAGHGVTLLISLSPQDWETAREQPLVKEKALTRAHDALAAERRRMPWAAVDMAYKFAGPKEKVSLRELFHGRRQLIVYRAVFEPGVFGWPDQACRGCSMVADQVTHVAHLNARDATLVFVSHAPQTEIARLKARMGWDMPWYSLTDSFGVDNWHGTNAFIRDGDRVFRTYFVNSRGDEPMGSTWSYLDITALRRQEVWEDSPEGYPQTPAYKWWNWHDNDAAAPDKTWVAVSDAGEAAFRIPDRIPSHERDCDHRTRLRDEPPCRRRSLAATPSFAIVALLSAAHGDDPTALLCAAAQDASPLRGMVPMNVMMSAFHAAPWVKLISRRRMHRTRLF